MENGDFVISNSVLREYKGKGGVVTIPNGITSIGRHAFEGCSNVTQIILPDSLAVISGSAFSKCNNLVSINLPDNLISIGDYAFSDCANLSNIVIPKKLRSIGDAAFKGCKKLQDNDGFVIVNDILYDYFGIKKDVSVPDGVTSIRFAFDSYKNITNVFLPNSLDTIGSFAFSGCSNLKTIRLPERLISIEYRAFEDCFSLTNIVLPNTIKTIRENAFDNCENLTIHINGNPLCEESSLLGVKKIIAPNLSLLKLLSSNEKKAAARGFLSNCLLYQNPMILKEYKKYILQQKGKMLLKIFEEDDVISLSTYLEIKKGRIKDFKEEYLHPAAKAKAKKCIIYLMNWTNENII